MRALPRTPITTLGAAQFSFSFKRMPSFSFKRRYSCLAALCEIPGQRGALLLPVPHEPCGQRCQGCSSAKVGFTNCFLLKLSKEESNPSVPVLKLTYPQYHGSASQLLHHDGVLHRRAPHVHSAIQTVRLRSGGGILPGRAASGHPPATQEWTVMDRVGMTKMCCFSLSPVSRPLHDNSARCASPMPAANTSNFFPA